MTTTASPTSCSGCGDELTGLLSFPRRRPGIPRTSRSHRVHRETPRVHRVLLLPPEGKAITPTLIGHGIRLEPISLHHLPALAEASSDPDTFCYFVESGNTHDGLLSIVQRALEQTTAGTTEAWVTVLLSGSEPKVIGSTRLADIDHRHRTCELGWTWLAAPFRGTGVNPRVKLLQLTHAFETLGMRRVALKTHHANERSQRAMIKLGAQYEGTFRNHMLMPDGSSRDTRWYSILDSDWPAVKARLLERVFTAQDETPASP